MTDIFDHIKNLAKESQDEYDWKEDILERYPEHHITEVLCVLDIDSLDEIVKLDKKEIFMGMIDAWE